MLLAEEIAERLVGAAELTKSDTVLEIGTGTGKITNPLAKSAGQVTTWEVDPVFFQLATQTLQKFKNVRMLCGDAFSKENTATFDVCVTSLPYSESLRFTKWLSTRTNHFKRCVAIVQSEFVQKLVSTVGSGSYRAVSVIAQNSFIIERLFTIPSHFFDPPPKVLSEAVKLTPRQDIAQSYFNSRRIHILNQLFSYRGRLLSSAAKKIGFKEALPEYLLKTRVEDLTPKDFADIIPKLEVHFQ